MSRKLGSFTLAAFSVAACSLINSPDDLKPVDDGTGAFDQGGSAGSGAGKKASNDGGSDGTTPKGDGGSDTSQAGDGTGNVGTGGCSEPDCGESLGGAPPIGRACDVSADDCSGAAPICDAAAGECRACADNDECQSEVGRDFCVTDGKLSGRCAECESDDDCGAAKPICGDVGACRGCSANDECDSGVCGQNGACELPATTVYALAETGIGGPTCGTLDQPCRFLADATKQLTAARHNLVLIKTINKFNDGISLPAVKGLRIIGNGVSVSGPNGGVVVPAGATVAIDGILLAGSTATATAGIVCNGGSINVTNSTLQDNLSGILAKDCDVLVSQCLIQRNSPNAANNTAGISSTCTAAHCDKTTSFVRNKFLDNGFAVYLYDQLAATLDNNLFLRNGADGYTRVVQLNSDTTHFGYNTVVENFNNGIYVGIVPCGGTCTFVGNLSFNNFPAHAGDSDYADYAAQVFYNATLTYSLTEATYPGATNRTGNPKFVDAANGDYTPGPGSPAIDNGNPSDYPPLDINGKKRGSKPDIGAYESN